MHRGFIKIHRKFTEWEWYDDINTKVLFLHLILTANYKDKKWKGIEVKRGQLITSHKNLSDETQLSVQQVRTSIDKLKLTGELTSKSTNKYTLITIVNYNLYQDDNRQDNIQITNEQQTDNKQITTTKERKEGNKEKNDKNKENWQAIFKEAEELWNHYADEAKFKKIQSMNDKRKKQFKERWNDELEKDMNNWIEFCCQICDTPFLLGKNERGWKANIDWALRPSSISKTLEGAYINDKDRI